jgi:hypothetical protein
MTPERERRPGKGGSSNIVDATSTDPQSISEANGRTGLTEYLQDQATRSGVSLKAITVLAPQNDPFRVGTAASRRDGAWLAGQVEASMPGRRIHLRGLHYALIGQTKPDGSEYINTDANWEWLIGKAAKSARWNGYIDFDQIVDQKNAPPVIRLADETQNPMPYLSVGDLSVELPLADEMVPSVVVDPPFAVSARQKYRLAMYGEKASLEDVLGPIAEQYDADLFLPSGEMSDTLIWQMASSAAADGRPLVLFTFSDCDPAGWQMPISIARKLQAFKAMLYPDLEFRVVRVGLTPEHVRRYGLPSTPLKEKESRADKWTEATGVRQTEIDALATLRPEVLRDVALEAIQPFFDSTLHSRAAAAQSEWLAVAQARFDEVFTPDDRAALIEEAQEELADLQQQMDELSDSLRVDVDPDVLDLPEIVVPEFVDGDDEWPKLLVDSDDAFVNQCAHLIASKGYDDVGGDR